MKKITVIALIALMSFSVFAYSTQYLEKAPFNYDLKGFVPQEVSSTNYINHALYEDPTTLKNGKFSIMLPSLSVTHFNTSGFLKTSEGSVFLSNLLKFKFNELNLVSALYATIQNFGVGTNALVNLDGGFGFAGKNWAFGVNARALVENNSASGAGTDSDFFPQADAAATFAYNINFIDNNSLSLDLGIAARFAYRTRVVNAIDVGTLENFDFSAIPFKAGWAVPVDVTLAARILDGKVGLILSGTNLNGYYYMKNYENLEKAITMNGGTDATTVYTPWSLNAAVELNPQWKAVNPKLRVEFAGIYSLFADKDVDNELLSHLNVRADVDILKIINLNVANNAGYWQFGAGVGIAGNTVSVLYGWHEAGAKLGYKPVDTLTFSVKLGYNGN